MKEKRAFTVRRMALIAMMTAVICVCAWITVPFAVPFTMQTFGVFAALLLLGGLDGTISIALYLLLGCVGLPVFSGFRGGFGHLAGPTGGFLIGFLVTGIAHLLLEPVSKRMKSAARVAVCFGEHVLSYLAGTLWFIRVGGTGFFAALSVCVLPYLLPDLVKIALAELLSRRLGKLIRR